MGHRDKKEHQLIAHRSRFVDYATGIVGNRALGEDVVQEAFIRMHTVVADRTVDEPVGYLRRIVRNVAIDWLRRLRSEKGVISSDTDIDSLAHEQPSAEDRLTHQAQLYILHQAMAELPERTRIALEMHRLEGCKLREIAERLDISVTLAHSLVAEGLLHCRQRLTESM